MNEDRKEAFRRRFHLRDGAFFGQNKFKNLWWHLNGEEIGYGDLRDSDITIIAAAVEAGEVFEGFNEQHMTRNMLRESPMIRITVNGVEFPEHVPVSEKTLKEIWRLGR